MSVDALKVGELARRTGLSIRTLHHYDEIGLLRPSLHTSAGHRLYTGTDVARLQQIVSLRQLGFSLEEIRSCLSGDSMSPLETVRMHVVRLREQIALQQELCQRLESLADHFEAAEEVSAATFLQTIEVMNMIENYYTPEQLEALKKRREQVGPERMQQAPNDWSQVFADFRAAMEQGTDPGDPRVQAIEQRRQALVDEFTGGDTGIAESLKRLWTEQGDKLAAQYGYEHDPQLADYMEKASEAAKRPS